MKKLLAIMLVFACTTTYSQSIQVGGKAGVNISNFKGGNVNSNALVGYHFGGILNIFLGQHFSVGPEVLFSSQGARFESAGNKTDVRISYLAIPVLAKLQVGTIYFEAGPQFGFKTGEHNTVPGLSGSKFAKNFDFAIDGGVGYHAKSGVGVGARYVLGLSQVGDFTSSTASPNFKNGVIQLSLSFTIFHNNPE